MDPLDHTLRRRIRHLREKRRGARPSGASGALFDAIPGPAQFQVRTRGAILHATRGGVRIEADCSTDGPWADC
eukprot:3055613-Alexandrium_andersonii.AAC.1